MFIVAHGTIKNYYLTLTDGSLLMKISVYNQPL